MDYWQRLLRIRQGVDGARVLCFLGFMVVAAGAGAQSGPSVCPETAIFVFGDSLTDTGNIAHLGIGGLQYPYGQSYNFPGTINPSRFCDGRLVVDFFAQAFGFPFLEPIAAQFSADRGSGFKYGANFAYGGATAVTNLLESPFSLSSEVLQFVSFKFASTIPYVDPSYFRRALYVIAAIGTNDFLNAYKKGHTPAQVINITVPLALKAVRKDLEALYAGGSRSFFVFNLPPGGCIPSLVTEFEGTGASVDEAGCLSEYNGVVEVYNAQLHANVQEYRSRWSDASIVFFDTYAASKVIYSNPEAYGFQKKKTIVACCGYGGKHNYNPSIGCASSGEVKDPVTNLTTFVNISSACADPAQYLNWDGNHPTQALNRQVSLLFLKGRFVEGLPGSSNLSLLCNLNFTSF